MPRTSAMNLANIFRKQSASASKGIVCTATVEDAAAIARVYFKTAHAHYAEIVDRRSLQRLATAHLAARWELLLTRRRWVRSAFIAEDDDGRVVGFAAAGPARVASLRSAWGALRHLRAARVAAPGAGPAVVRSGGVGARIRPRRYSRRVDLRRKSISELFRITRRHCNCRDGVPLGNDKGGVRVAEVAIAPLSCRSARGIETLRPMTHHHSGHGHHHSHGHGSPSVSNRGDGRRRSGDAGIRQSSKRFLAGWVTVWRCCPTRVTTWRMWRPWGSAGMRSGIARKPSHQAMTFGYHRVGVFAALLNASVAGCHRSLDRVGSDHPIPSPWARERWPDDRSGRCRVWWSTRSIGLGLHRGFEARDERPQRLPAHDGDAVSALGVMIAGVLVATAHTPLGRPRSRPS